MDSTIEYYNKNAKKFIESTINIDMSHLYGEFEKNIPSGGKILDLGCGSGRDSKYFLKKGYQVTAVDASETICKATSEYLGIDVLNMNIGNLCITDMFDGIWACASLLHIKKSDMKRVLGDLLRVLNPQGVLYASWKYGEGERTENGKYYSDYDENQIRDLLDLSEIKYKIWISYDQTRIDVRWINLIAYKDDK